MLWSPSQDEPRLCAYHCGPDQRERFHTGPEQLCVLQHPRGGAPLWHPEAAFHRSRAHDPPAPCAPPSLTDPAPHGALASRSDFDLQSHLEKKKISRQLNGRHRPLKHNLRERDDPLTHRDERLYSCPSLAQPLCCSSSSTLYTCCLPDPFGLSQSCELLFHAAVPSYPFTCSSCKTA